MTSPVRRDPDLERLLARSNMLTTESKRILQHMEEWINLQRKACAKADVLLGRPYSPWKNGDHDSADRPRPDDDQLKPK